MKNFLQKTQSKVAFIFFVLFNSTLAFCANPLNDLKSNVDKEMNETMKTIMGMVNTFSLTIGLAWVIVGFAFYIGSPERFKENMKLFVIVAVVLSLLYGISSAYK